MFGADSDEPQEIHLAHQRVHRRLQRHRGSAWDQNCVDCGKRAFDWSQIRGTMGDNIWEHYEPRCRSCHNIYDGLIERNQSEEGRVRNRAGRASSPYNRWNPKPKS